MPVISLHAFRRDRPRAPQPRNCGWRPGEFAELVRLFMAMRERARAESYELGLTERGDPQFYVLGDDVEQSCVCSVSRLCQQAQPWYVVENGNGQLLFDGCCLHDLIDDMVERWRIIRRHLSLVSKCIIGLFACEMALEDDVDVTGRAFAPLLSEPFLNAIGCWMPQAAMIA
jgi:hypothetical protein